VTPMRRALRAASTSAGDCSSVRRACATDEARMPRRHAGSLRWSVSERYIRASRPAFERSQSRKAVLSAEIGVPPQRGVAATA
jgi:hypothetical protein